MLDTEPRRDLDLWVKVTAWLKSERQSIYSWPTASRTSSTPA